MVSSARLIQRPEKTAVSLNDGQGLDPQGWSYRWLMDEKLTSNDKAIAAWTRI
jgi:hypothetical protein